MNRFGPLEIMDNGLEDCAMQTTSFTIGRIWNHGKRARSRPHGWVKTIGKGVDKSVAQTMACNLSELVHTSKSNHLEDPMFDFDHIVECKF